MAKVHKLFDIDNGGYIEAEELLALGKMRRSLGQKQGEWTKEMNDRFMAKLDSSGDGKLEMAEFSSYFNGQLPSERKASNQSPALSRSSLSTQLFRP